MMKLTKILDCPYCLATEAIGYDSLFEHRYHTFYKMKCAKCKKEFLYMHTDFITFGKMKGIKTINNVDDLK